MSRRICPLGLLIVTLPTFGAVVTCPAGGPVGNVRLEVTRTDSRSPLSLDAKAALDTIARNLSDADRILAETANRAAGGGNQDLINEGDEERADGEYANAVEKYRKAWQQSVP